MMQKTAEELNAWKAQMKTYEKSKRTKRPFGRDLPRTEYVTYEKVKNDEVRFNPILQNYKSPQDEALKTQNDQFQRAKSLMTHLKQKGKYERPYDIVNLHGMDGQKSAGALQQTNNKKLGPIRNAYNVINNQKLPDYFFDNREMRLPVERQFNLIANNEKQYNIVTGMFKQNHEEKVKNEELQQKQMVMGKYWKTHEFDPVFGKFYDANKEEQFQKELKEQQKVHGHDHEKHLPPSYVMREPFIPDPTKQLPESLQTLEERRMNAKKRYKLKYCIEDEYNRRNLEDEEKYEVVIKNRVHNGRVMDEKMKEFDIITMKNYPEDRAEKLYKKQIVKKHMGQAQQHNWENQNRRISELIQST